MDARCYGLLQGVGFISREVFAGCVDQKRIVWVITVEGSQGDAKYSIPTS